MVGDEKYTTKTARRRYLIGSMRCTECAGRGEVSVGERHGFSEYTLCPSCKGSTVVPIWRYGRDITEEFMRGE